MGRWEIPNNWQWVKVGEIANVFGGGTPSTRISQNFSEDTGIAWLTPADLSGYESTYIKRGKRNITQAGYDSSSAVLLPPGTVLYTSRAPIGYCVIAENEIATNQGFKSFVLLGQTVPEYIRYYLVSSKEYAESFASGTTFKELSGSRIKELLIPLPPLNEQKRVSQKIKALQSRSTKARKALESIPPLLEKFRQSVLSSAFRGDLTADWRAQNPDIEPAEKLLERIRKERRKRWEEDELAKMKANGKTPKGDKWKKKYKEPEPVDTTDLPELPEGWCWATIDTIAFVTKLAGFEYTKYVTYDPNGDLPVIKAENAGKYGFKETDFSFVQSESVTHLTRSFLKGGEVLMTFVGAGVGQVAMVPEGQQYFLGPNIAMIRNESSFALTRYIELFLRSPLGFGLAMTFVKAVAQPSLSMKTIRRIPIAIPPIKEQKIIDSNLSQYNDIIEEVESIITTLKEKYLTLDQSILSKAFRGELVPQDPNDEPASKLLERIKQEKAFLEAGKKQRGKAGRKKVTRKKKATAMAKKNERRPLVEVLQPHSSGLSPEELFQQAGFDEYLVDEFYIELKNEVVSGNIIEDRPDQERVILRLNAA